MPQTKTVNNEYEHFNIKDMWHDIKTIMFSYSCIKLELEKSQIYISKNTDLIKFSEEIIKLNNFKSMNQAWNKYIYNKV